MQQPAPTASPSGSSTFAGMLAAFATPAPKRQIAWNDDDLADDVATLSYERALRAHGRYKAPAASEAFPELPRDRERLQDPERLRIYEVGTEAGAARTEAVGVSSADRTPAAPTNAASSANLRTVAQAPYASEASALADRRLKCASITIRMSTAECTQLRKRAADAGLTVSAYLRSCTFEAESLRALVKDTLAQLRSTAPHDQKVTEVPIRRGWRDWLAWLLPRARAAQA